MPWKIPNSMLVTIGYGIAAYPPIFQSLIYLSKFENFIWFFSWYQLIFSSSCRCVVVNSLPKMHQNLERILIPAVSFWYSFFVFFLSIDVNECETSGMCPNGVCKNMMGMYKCICDKEKGFMPNANETGCIGKWTIILFINNMFYIVNSN